MDNDLREEIHADLAPCNDEDFLREYEKDILKNSGKNLKFSIIQALFRCRRRGS